MNIFEKLFGISRTLATNPTCAMLRYNRVTASYDYFPQVRTNFGADGTFPLSDVPVMEPGNVMEYQPNIFVDGGELYADMYFTQTYNPELTKTE